MIKQWYNLIIYNYIYTHNIDSCSLVSPMTCHVGSPRMVLGAREHGLKMVQLWSRMDWWTASRHSIGSALLSMLLRRPWVMMGGWWVDGGSMWISSAMTPKWSKAPTVSERICWFQSMVISANVKAYCMGAFCTNSLVRTVSYLMEHANIGNLEQCTELLTTPSQKSS